MEEDPAALTAARDRLDVVDAMLVGIDQAGVVLSLVGEAEDREQLVTLLRDRLRLDEAGAIAVASLQISRMTKADRRRLTEERAQLQSVLSG